MEAELDRFIEKRSQKGEQDPDEQEELWKASVKAYHERERRETASAWYAYECRLARIHASLAQEHEARATLFGEMVERMDNISENGHHEKGEQHE